MLSIKTFVLAAALSAGVGLALPTAGEAMPQSTPVPQGIAKDGNIVNVNHRKRWKRWQRYCNRTGDWRCYRGDRRARYYRHRYYDNRYYDEPYYGYYHRRHYRNPGIGLEFRID